jgi:hypothetical protein
VIAPGTVNSAQLVVRHAPLVAPVLSRVVGMLAARAQFPIDRLDDALLVTDALAAHASSFTPDGQVGVAIVAREGQLELRVGPLRAGAGSHFLAAAELPGVGNVLERVADQVHVEAGEDEHLIVRLGVAGVSAVASTP